MPGSIAPRILLSAGKGGVGKTTVAAATAVACARAGQRTLAMSIDSAHNLSDVLGTPLGSTPTPVAERLHGLEVDLNQELSANWSAVTDFFRTMTADNPHVTRLVAEECAVLPGMEEVFGLMRLQTVVDSGEFDVIVLDAPPTGDLMKFLRLPDVLQWVMERYRPWERGVLQRARPLADALGWPLPPEPVVDEMEGWYTRVRKVSAMLADHSRVSVRLVMTPDRVALAETRRALTWTCLLGMNVDGIILNRVLPEGEQTGLYRAWLERQSEVLAEAETAFGDLPVLCAELQASEVIGLPRLEAFASDLFQDRDPERVWSSEPPVRWSESGPNAELRLRLPFLKRGQFRLLAGEEGLTLMVGNQRRIVPLPASVRSRAMLGARYQDGWLIVQYGRKADSRSLSS